MFLSSFFGMFRRPELARDGLLVLGGAPSPVSAELVQLVAADERRMRQPYRVGSVADLDRVRQERARPLPIGPDAGRVDLQRRQERLNRHGGARP